MSHLLTPAQAQGADVSVVGGKAAGLARLGAVARVPAWFVVSAEAFGERLAQPDVAPIVARELSAIASLDPTTDAARALLVAAERELREVLERPLDPRLQDSIVAAVEALGTGPYAVRSSMVGEDAGERSFAGQFDTWLEQPDAAAVVRAIARCWGSAFTARSLAYRLRTGVPLDRCAMAVVVQRMVRGRVSGVAFTANPVTGRHDEVVVTACWGLGEGIVGGACATDEHVLDHAGVERSATIADKTVQVLPAEGGGTREAPVPSELRRVRCLSADAVGGLAREAVAVARSEGRPLDLEWTIDEQGTVHWLQARPVTTLGRESPRQQVRAAAPTRTRIVWDNSNIQESYCGVTTPLTFSFALSAYASVYEQTMRLVGIPEQTIVDHRPLLRSMLGLIRGRVYYNLNNWYRLLLLLPSFGRNKADMEKMMGLDSPVDFVEDQVLDARAKLARAPRLALTMARLLREFGRLESSVSAFLERFDVAMGRVDRRRLASMGLDELLDTAAWLRREVIEHWETPIVNDLYVMQASGRLRRELEAIVGAERAPSAWTALVAGEEGIESTEPTRALLRLAKVARDAPDLARLLRDSPAEAAIARARAAHAGFSALVDRFLERYGDRCMGELKLESVSLREDTTFVARVLVNYLERDDLDADAFVARERRVREETEREVMAAVGPLGRARLRRALRAARSGIKARENMRLARTRLFGVYRDLYRAVGQRLHDAGRIDQPRDVFYLTTDEIAAWCDGTAVSADLAAIARARKQEFAGYEREAPPPNRIETWGAVHDGEAVTAPPVPTDRREARVLRGTGASAGIVEARIRVVMSASDDLGVNGRVLTTLRTDPGWAPLFPTARAVLVERGSTLSHSAVLARELGIPCVVGVPDLLAIVKDGERVRLDGAAGTVERLDTAADQPAADRAEARS